MAAEESDRPLIAVSIADILPPGIEDGIEAEMAAPGLPLAIVRKRHGPFAGIELYLPSAVMLFVAAGYFNGFLKKMSEDHYDRLRAAAKKLLRRSLTRGDIALGRPGSRPGSGFSLTYSIVGEVAPGMRFKLVFATDIGPDDGSRAIDAFLELLHQLHTGTLDEATRVRLSEAQPVGGTILVTFDPKTKQVVLVPREAAMQGSAAAHLR